MEELRRERVLVAGVQARSGRLELLPSSIDDGGLCEKSTFKLVRLA
ncbi:hypothetical protein [Phytohabitans houttuyneae]|nr:hypothetical protein [Phytohabitans houttuyneae]